MAHVADDEDGLRRDCRADCTVLLRGSREIEYLGSAHDDGELELLKASARQRLAAG